MVVMGLVAFKLAILAMREYYQFRLELAKLLAAAAAVFSAAAAIAGVLVHPGPKGR